MDLLTKLSTFLNYDQAGLKLFLSLLSATPIGLFYQYFLFDSYVLIKNFYFIFMGLFLSYINYGNDTIHLIITIFVVYCTLKIKPQSIYTNTFNFIFVCTYLMYGYYSTLKNSYGFEWTLPHCVLTLRLIALSFNVFDGKRCQKKNDVQKCDHDDHLQDCPNIIDLYAHCLFPCSFLVGPQYEFHIFKKFIKRNKQNLNIKASLEKFLTGLIYISIFVFSTKNFDPETMLTKKFMNTSFLWKITVFSVLGKAHLMKYISVWLFAESSCIMVGLNSDNENGKVFKINNVDVFLYETTSNFAGLIKAFNIQTNNWTAKYIYKRLKFLNLQIVSHLASLFFLAAWHGLKTGYYVAFLLEFITIFNEKETIFIVNKLENQYPNFKKFMNLKLIQFIVYIMLRTNVVITLGYSFIPFLFLTHKKYLPLMKVTYFYVIVQAVVIYLMNKLVKFIFLKNKLKEN